MLKGVERETRIVSATETVSRVIGHRTATVNMIAGIVTEIGVTTERKTGKIDTVIGLETEIVTVNIAIAVARGRPTNHRRLSRLLQGRGLRATAGSRSEVPAPSTASPSMLLAGESLRLRPILLRLLSIPTRPSEPPVTERGY
jgi:hypothetical protein